MFGSLCYYDQVPSGAFGPEGCRPWATLLFGAPKHTGYSDRVITIRKTPEFDAWLSGLRDRRARQRIVSRIDRLSLGNFGDVRPVGDGVSELRVHYGPGYRVYLVQRGDVILLCGGDKATQGQDIGRAKAIAKEFEK